MARAYRLGFWRRLIIRIIGALLRLDVKLPHTYLLTAGCTALLRRDAKLCFA
jgi:hypothetical protein